jgi:hypothetical protein
MLSHAFDKGRIKAGERDGLVAEVDEIVFDLARPVGCEGVLDAGASNPPTPTLGC